MNTSVNVTLYTRTFRFPLTRIERFRAHVQTLKAIASMVRDARGLD